MARKDITKRRKQLYTKLKTAKLQEITESWADNQHHQDIEQQVRGEKLSRVDQESRPMNPHQRRMFEALTAPLVKDVQAVFLRRTEAINALVAYCAEEESLRTEVTEARKPSAPDELRQTHLSSDQQMDEIRKSTFASVVGEKNVRRCFLCVAKAARLGRDHSLFNDLCHTFYNSHNLAYHLTRTHLDGIPEDGTFECPLCHVTLLHKNHLRLHSHVVHGISTDRKREMRSHGK